MASNNYDIFNGYNYDSIVQKMRYRHLINLDLCKQPKKHEALREALDTSGMLDKILDHYSDSSDRFAIACAIAMRVGAKIHEGHWQILGEYIAKYDPRLQAQMEAAYDGYQNDGTPWDFATGKHVGVTDSSELESANTLGEAA